MSQPKRGQSAAARPWAEGLALQAAAVMPKQHTSARNIFSFTPTLDNYRHAFGQQNYLLYLFNTFVVATETGILHRLHKEMPGRRFVAADDSAVCGYMKQITLEKVRSTLRDLAPAVEVPLDVAGRARVAIDRMLAVTA